MLAAEMSLMLFSLAIVLHDFSHQYCCDYIIIDEIRT